MGFSRRFTLGYAWRLALLLLAVAGLAATLRTPGLAAARVVAAVLAAWAVWALWHHVGTTDRQLARFIDSLRHRDFSQSFGDTRAARLDRLGDALDRAVRALRAERGAAADEARIQAALADESPAALLLVDEEGRVTLASKAARRLFGRLEGTRIDDFLPYGAGLVALLHGEDRRAERLLPLTIDGVVQRAMATRSVLTLPGRRLGIVAVQPIQAALSSVELAAQADLVRVLTHEIMNSMTPVVSLAGTAARLIAGVEAADHPDIADARTAIETLERRASGIMHFVEAYRAFSRPPTLQRRRFAAGPWAAEIARLFAASAQGGTARLTLDVTPDDIMLDGDPDLLAQVVINLLKNGAEAAAGHAEAPAVTLTIALIRGGRTLLTIADNGPGIPPALAEEVFLPFFTTKREGTGVGLSLARRIVTAHDGAIVLAPGEGGACFRIVL